jgi:hypothetical protein
MNFRLVASLVSFTLAAVAQAAPSNVSVVSTDSGHVLHVDGQPFWVKGVGGHTNLEMLRDLGGNAIRTWGADDLEPLLDQAQSLGLKVVVGIWLGHERHGFDYHNVEQVAEQYRKATEAINRYKDHPAVLAWGIGNEMEMESNGRNAAVWSHIQAIAAYAKRVDPNHPTMTVIAEMGGPKIQAIHALCPDIDIIGINSYGGAPSVPKRYRELGGTKPYMITEFGPLGTWEVTKTDWGAPPEPTSTQKAEQYRRAYEQGILAEKGKLCLGSFAFVWGHKQEATATWFGMFLPDGARTASVDTMSELWTGKPVANRVPVISPISIDTTTPAPGQTIRATVDVSDPEGDPLTVEWKLKFESRAYGVGGDAEPVPERVEHAVVRSDLTSAEVRMPDEPDRYRLFVTVHDNQGGAATANVPLMIAAPAATAPLAPKATLPLAIYGDDVSPMPFAPSGFMGNTSAVTVTDRGTDKPHTGATAMRVAYNAATGWAGVAWQNPADDWGDAEGGFDLTGATKLTFWARGETGGETVEFKFGILGNDKPHHDTAAGSLAVTLTPEWKQYEIPVAGKDLRRIKTGFVWVVAADGKPVVFHLDDIRWE